MSFWTGFEKRAGAMRGLYHRTMNALTHGGGAWKEHARELSGKIHSRFLGANELARAGKHKASLAVSGPATRAQTRLDKVKHGIKPFERDAS